MNGSFFLNIPSQKSFGAAPKGGFILPTTLDSTWATLWADDKCAEAHLFMQVTPPQTPSQAAALTFDISEKYRYRPKLMNNVVPDSHNSFTDKSGGMINRHGYIFIFFSENLITETLVLSGIIPLLAETKGRKYILGS